MHERGDISLSPGSGFELHVGLKNSGIGDPLKHVGYGERPFRAVQYAVDEHSSLAIPVQSDHALGAPQGAQQSFVAAYPDHVVVVILKPRRLFAGQEVLGLDRDLDNGRRAIRLFILFILSGSNGETASLLSKFLYSTGPNNRVGTVENRPSRRRDPPVSAADNRAIRRSEHADGVLPESAPSAMASASSMPITAALAATSVHDGSPRAAGHQLSPRRSSSAESRASADAFAAPEAIRPPGLCAVITQMGRPRGSGYCPVLRVTGAGCTQTTPPGASIRTTAPA